MEVANLFEYAKDLIDKEDHSGIGVNCHSFVHAILSKYLGLEDVFKEQAFRSIRFELFRLMINDYKYEYGGKFNVLEIEPNPEFVEFLTDNPMSIVPYLADHLVTYHVVTPLGIPEEGNNLRIDHSGIILPSMYQNDISDPDNLLCIERKSSSFIAKKVVESSPGVAVKPLSTALEKFEEAEMNVVYAVWKKVGPEGGI